MFRSRLFLVFVISAIAIAACRPFPSSVDGEWRQPTNASSKVLPTTAVVWHDCQKEADQLAGSHITTAQFDCGTIRVPQDWSKSNTSKTISLALMRVRSNNQHNRIGSMLINPGGPGASGIKLAAITPLFLPSDLRGRFDIIGFDPRGVGKSAPVSCSSDKEKDAAIAADPDPNEQQFDQQVQSAQNFANECVRKYGASLPTFSTEQAARDMDAIREAVGDKKLTYLGYSYGTLLGAVYSQLFPGKIRAVTLDGAVDPTLHTTPASEQQAAGFENAFNDFAADCEKRGAACKLGSDVRKTVGQLLEKGRTNPPHGKDGRRATAGYVLWSVIAALYSKESWPVLETALNKYQQGDPSGVFSLVDQYNERDSSGHYSNTSDANTVINCSDETEPATVDQIRDLQGQWRQKYPLFGSLLAGSLTSCATWKGGHDPYPTGQARGAPPILVVGTTNDPATPYANTQKLADMLGTGRVLTWEGEGHTAYPQNSCVNGVVDNYLIKQELPSKDVTCSPRK